MPSTAIAFKMEVTRDVAKGKGVSEATEEQLLFGKYRMLGRLGSGHFGTVYLAEHVGLSALRAVKVLARDSQDCDAFLREARLMKGLCHVGIPIIYDIEEQEDRAYIIEEYVEGESIAALVGRAGRLPLSQVIRYGIQLCNIISYLHSLKFPIIHLDIQPNNVMICDDSVKLLDFGSAVLLSEAGGARTRCGTPDFAAPEQFMGGALDRTTDIYAIGVLLYFMASGTLPTDRRAFGDRRAEPGFCQVIGRCLQKDQSRRYTCAEELREQLAVLQSLPEAGRTDENTSLVVAVWAARPGTGATHLAMGLSAYLNRLGIPCLYEEKNEGRAVWEMADQDSKVRRIGSFYYKGSCPLCPLYGGAIGVASAEFRVRIQDYGYLERGEGIQAEEPSDWRLIVCGCRPWEQARVSRLRQAVSEDDRLIWLYNHSDASFRRRIQGKALGKRCQWIPYFPDPFITNEDTEAWFAKLATELGVVNTAGRGRIRGWISAWLEKLRLQRLHRQKLR